MRTPGTFNAHRRGFSLIEIILVVFIIGLVSAFSIPSFVRSFQGAKLRTSARSVVMAHRFARSVAVLQQKPVAVYFYTEQQKIEVVSLSPEGRSGASDIPAEQEVESYDVKVELEKYLEAGVRILEFEFDQDGQSDREAHWVNYFPSGMSDAYAIRLMDEQDKTAMIRVNPLSGKATVEDLDGVRL